MKKIFYLLSFICLFASCSKKEVTTANYEVIPLPQKIEQKQGEPFVLNNSTVITYPKDNQNLKRVATFLADYIKFSAGLHVKVSDQPQNKDAIVLDTTLVNDNKEAYTIQIDNKQIVINGASSAGVFYGIQTIRKSIPVGENIEAVDFKPTLIEDYPRFAYRGMHLDVGRHFFPIEFIKEYIDILALHNMNRFHWHLTDDQGWRIEIKKHPLLTEKGSQRKETVIGRNSGKFDGKPYGGFYTQDEAREIVAYAKDRFITVIPEIDLPGHMLGALTAYPELGCTGGPYEVEGTWGVFDDVLCAGNDQTYTFIEDVMTEIIDIFPSEYIHVGGDECPKVRWKECPKCQAKIKSLGIQADSKHTAEEKLQSHVIAYTEKFLNSKGRQIIGWDEILEGGLAPNATVMSWRSTEGGIEAAKQGNKAIMVPTSHLYFDYYQTTNTEDVPLAIGGYVPIEKVYNFDPIPSDLDENTKKNIIGVQANLWTEYIDNTKQVEYMIMPRIDALSEVQWTMPENKNYEQFIPRLLNMLKLYDKEGYNYSKTIFDVQSNITTNSDKGIIEVTLSTIDGTPVYYTIDGTEPTDKSQLYTNTIEIDKPVTVKAKAIRTGIESPTFTKQIDMNKATTKSIKLNKDPKGSYAFNGAPTLVDGISGNKGSYKDGTWIGFSEGDVEATIDLKEATEFSKIDLDTYVCTGDWIFGITGLEVAVSDDGKNFKTIAKQTFEEPTQHKEGVENVAISFDKTKARYVKLTIHKTNVLPDWHTGKGLPAYLFIDEIRIN